MVGNKNALIHYGIPMKIIIKKNFQKDVKVEKITNVFQNKKNEIAAKKEVTSKEETNYRRAGR
ncbi:MULTISPECIES: hypothetical protein [Parachlamydia]|nr:hypothetical protein [Parachlamydia acanthamoebae]